MEAIECSRVTIEDLEALGRFAKMVVGGHFAGYCAKRGLASKKRHVSSLDRTWSTAFWRPSGEEDIQPFRSINERVESPAVASALAW